MANSHICYEKTAGAEIPKKMYWILGKKSELSVQNKLLIYKTI